ncbi:MAG: hypothetical protein A2V98_22075 [Planctomycetes bacterium RBG_16_64_12]|nr:MAG: hypothetical protein A2V98_22075 [Planctomycetes bacterium RBG_16_64_12]
MTVASPKYIVDTCSFTMLRRVYPREMFSPVWALLSDLATSGVVASIDQVLEELRVQEDDVVTKWAEAHASIFLPLDAPIQTKAKEVLARFPQNFLDLRKRTSGADPFVVAAAIVNTAAVVTEEKRTGGRAG